MQWLEIYCCGETSYKSIYDIHGLQSHKSRAVRVRLIITGAKLLLCRFNSSTQIHLWLSLHGVWSIMKHEHVLMMSEWLTGQEWAGLVMLKWTHPLLLIHSIRNNGFQQRIIYSWFIHSLHHFRFIHWLYSGIWRKNRDNNELKTERMHCSGFSYIWDAI